MQLAAIARFARTAFALPAVRAAILPLVLTAGLAATTGARSQADITDVRISDSLYRQWMERTGGRPIKPGYTGDAWPTWTAAASAIPAAPRPFHGPLRAPNPSP
jgi:hypothetical protein